jgi:hypothetical protein
MPALDVRCKPVKHTQKNEGESQVALEQVFSLNSLVAMLGWAALALASYLAQFMTITESVPGASFSSLAGVTALFSKAGNVMMGWTHYLAFDLFIGSWEVEDAGKRGVPHWLVLPCLFFTLMLGPVGLLLYMLLRWAWDFWGKEKVNV